MDNLDNSESNAKVSDSRFSNSCSSSQLRSNTLNQSSKKKNKKSKKKKQRPQSEVKPEEAALAECRPPDPGPSCVEPMEAHVNVVETPPPAHEMRRLLEVPEGMDISQETGSANSEDGLSCVVSMHDGLVKNTTSSLTATLGYPKDMWIGRPFIEFVHPQDGKYLASQVTASFIAPKTAQWTDKSCSTMVCRMVRYRGLSRGFRIKDRDVAFMRFFLKFTFKNVSVNGGTIIHLIIQASPLYSAFKVPNEVVTKPVTFVMRHDVTGHIEHIDPESVSYLGYFPQDVLQKDALQMYHPDDLPYLRQIYESIIKNGSVAKSRPYRMMTQNGDYLKLETEWSSSIKLWSSKLESVIGKHHILEGPSNPDVFQMPKPGKTIKVSEEEKIKVQSNRDTIIRIMNEMLTKPAESAKQRMTKRCQDLAKHMESVLKDQPKSDDDI